MLLSNARDSLAKYLMFLARLLLEGTSDFLESVADKFDNLRG